MSGDLTLQEGEQLFLRGCGTKGEAHGGFVWPLKVGAVVTEPGWDPSPVCGNGLHGNLWGGGDSDQLVVGGAGLVVAARGAVDLRGKHKFQTCRIVYVGTSLQDAAAWLCRHPLLPRGAKVHYGTATAGDYGTATAGFRGTATAGFIGTATAGYSGTATAGDYGIATAGHYATATAGDYGTAAAGFRGTATAGEGGVVCVRRDDGSWCAREIDGVKYLPGVKYRYCEEKKDLVPA